jgi:hypothetical protein
MTIDRRESFFALIERANRVGSLLPECPEDIDVDDPAALAELRIVLDEFDKARRAVEAEIRDQGGRPVTP